MGFPDEGGRRGACAFEPDSAVHQYRAGGETQPQQRPRLAPHGGHEPDHERVSACITPPLLFLNTCTSPPSGFTERPFTTMADPETIP